MATRNIDFKTALTLVNGDHTPYHSLVSNARTEERTEENLDIHEVFFEEDGMQFLYRAKYYIDQDENIQFLEVDNGHVVFHPVKD